VARIRSGSCCFVVWRLLICLWSDVQEMIFPCFSLPFQNFGLACEQAIR
jgi:hypothetical protein